VSNLSVDEGDGDALSVQFSARTLSGIVESLFVSETGRERRSNAVVHLIAGDAAGDGVDSRERRKARIRRRSDGGNLS
jgi:hypothetical protein